MPGDQEIREKISEWLAGSISISEFHRRFASETAEVHSEPKDSPARKLVADIDLSLSEYTGGYLSLEDLKRDFRHSLSGDSEFQDTAMAEIRQMD